MIIVDSCGWLEWFANGDLADKYKEYLADPEKLLVPAIVLYEVYKVIKRDTGEDKALLAVGYMKNSQIVPFGETLALSAADMSLQYGLAMADAIIAAAAKHHGCNLITSDSDLKHLPNVTFITK